MAALHLFPNSPVPLITPNGSDVISTVRNSAMLVQFTATKPTMTTFDQEVIEGVALDKHADPLLLSFTKKLFSREHTTGVTSAMAACRDYHYSLTNPWMDRGPRLLANRLYLTYASGMREKIDKAEFEAKKFAAILPQIVAEMQQDGKLGALFEAGKYPSQAECAAKFQFTLRFLPIPDGAHFLVDLADEDRKALVEDTEAAIAATMQDVWQRVIAAVTGMVEKLKVYEPPTVDADGKKVRAQHVFRDSLVPGMRELVGVLSVMNVANDERLTEIIGQMQTDLCFFDSDQLKESDSAREAVTEQAEAILAKISAIMS